MSKKGKKGSKKLPKKTVTSAFEKTVLSEFRKIDSRFDKTDSRFDLVNIEFRSLRKEINDGFATIDQRIDRLATHVDGFMKLHETLDIELRVMKEQMRRFEERLKVLETN